MSLADLYSDAYLQGLAAQCKPQEIPTGYTKEQWRAVLDKLNRRLPDRNDGEERQYPQEKSDGPYEAPEPWVEM